MTKPRKRCAMVGVGTRAVISRGEPMRSALRQALSVERYTNSLIEHRATARGLLGAP